MQMARVWMAAGLIGLTSPAAALAQAAPPVCPQPAAAEGVLAPWNEAVALPSGEIAAGQAARVKLEPVGAVRFAVAPEKRGNDASFGGGVSLTIAESGTYRVALATPGWIEVVGADGAIASSAHSHGPECTGIRKMVDFPLTPGTYTMQIAANPTAQTTLLVVRLP